MLLQLIHTGWRHASRGARRVRCLFSAIAMAALTVAGLPGQAATWDHAHGDATNSGFVDVATSPALRPLAMVSGIGSYAPGAGPVIGPDGTVYVGNEQGELRALHPDGSLAWKRTLAPSEAITASPVVDTDGSIYVVGVRTYTDHRVNPPVRRSESRLHRFTAGGGYLWDALFPGDSATTAPPNVWHSGGDTAILVPAAYRGLASKDVHLLAYTTGGALLANKLIGAIVSQVFGSNGLPEFWNIACGLTVVGCLVPPTQFCPGDFQPADPADRLPTGLSAPMPGVALFTFAGGGRPGSSRRIRRARAWAGRSRCRAASPSGSARRGMGS